MPVRLKTFLSSERISYFTTTAGLLRPHLAFFNPHSTHQLISAHTTSLQCCVVDPTAAKAELPPVPGGTPGWEVGTEGRDTFGHRRYPACEPLARLLLPRGCRCSPGLPGTRAFLLAVLPAASQRRQSKPWHRHLPQHHLENKPVHATRSERARSGGRPRRCRAPRHPDSRRHTLAVAPTPCPASSKSSLPAEPLGTELGTPSHCFWWEIQSLQPALFASRRYSPPVLNALGETRRAAVPAPGAGGPAPQSPQRMRTWGAAVPITVQPDLARGARVCGKQRASLLWGCSGRAAEEVLAVTECRGSEETDSRCFWTSLDVKSGLWEGGGRSEPGRMGSHCLLGHPDFLQTLSKNPPAQSPAQVMLNSHKAREASGCGMLYQGSTRMRLGKHAREPHGSKLTPGIRILTEQ